MTSLSPNQQTGFDNIMNWYGNCSDQTYALAGYAGTGKSTLARKIADEVDPERTIFCAFTGKAANVLREKGCATAGTIHGYLYSLKDHQRTILKQLEGELLEAIKKGDQQLIKQISETLDKKRQEFRKPVFGLNQESALAHAPLVIVDEYSMLPQRLINDLCEVVRNKILFMGDPFQLPPVGGKCPIEPDYFLTEIHRQALDNPIIRYSMAVREGRALNYCDEGAFRYMHRSKTDPSMYTDCDQIIVGRNKTRMEFNMRMRARLGREFSDLPVVSDKMICLKNNQAMGIFNGMISTVKTMTDVDEEKYLLELNENEGAFLVWKGDVFGEADKYDGYDEKMKAMDRFDYGYCITAHKSQGSEFDDVLIYNQPVGTSAEDRHRWLYTAITRSKKKCTLVEP